MPPAPPAEGRLCNTTRIPLGLPLMSYLWYRQYFGNVKQHDRQQQQLMVSLSSNELDTEIMSGT